MLVPSVINMDEDEILYITENVKFFEKLGFKLKINLQNIEILSLPVQFINADLDGVFTSVFQLSEDSKDLEHNFENAKQSIIATIACHNSIRTNQALSKEECISLVVQLQQCDNPYSCPHGRPIVWKLNISQIDSQFDRTY
jgi:DNA mismatch repair protein MutL